LGTAKAMRSMAKRRLGVACLSGAEQRQSAVLCCEAKAKARRTGGHDRTLGLDRIRLGAGAVILGLLRGHLRGRAVMDIKVDVKAEDVQGAVVRAIMESALGASLRAAVDKILSEKESWNAKALVDRVVEDELRKEISKIANTMIMEKRATIKERVTALLTDEAIQAFTSKSWDMFMNQKHRP